MALAGLAVLILLDAMDGTMSVATQVFGAILVTAALSVRLALGTLILSFVGTGGTLP